MLHDISFWVELPGDFNRQEVRGVIADLTKAGSPLHFEVQRQLIGEILYRRTNWPKGWELQKSKQSARKI